MATTTQALISRSEWKRLTADSHKWFADIGYHVAVEHYNKTITSKKKLKADENDEPLPRSEPAPHKVHSMITSCQICKRPLGQESRDLNYHVCPKCRLCASCGTETTSTESSYCLENELPIKHARCSSLNDVKTLNQQIALTNAFRLLPDLVMQVPQMSFEQQYELLRKMQDVCAFISVQINKNKKQLNQQLNVERLATAEAKATAEKKVNVTGTKTFKRSKNLMANAITALNAAMGGDKVKGAYSKACNLVLSEQIKKGVEANKARLLVLEAMVALGTPAEDAPTILDGKIN